MLRLILTCVQVFTSFVIVGLVLLQRGKGAEAGAGFGAGASGTVFGARGATTALSRATAYAQGDLPCCTSPPPSQRVFLTPAEHEPRTPIHRVILASRD